MYEYVIAREPIRDRLVVIARAAHSARAYVYRMCGFIFLSWESMSCGAAVCYAESLLLSICRWVLVLRKIYGLVFGRDISFLVCDYFQIKIIFVCNLNDGDTAGYLTEHCKCKSVKSRAFTN